MPYLIDRHGAIFSDDIVAIIKGQQQGIRSRVILRDGSLYQTRTRPGTLLRLGGALEHGLARLGTRQPRPIVEGRDQAIPWLAQP